MRIRPFVRADLADLSTLYSSCFAEHPWNEIIEPDDAMRILLKFLEPKSIGFVAEISTGVIGFSGGVPACKRASVLSIVGEDWSDAFYHAELFINTQSRASGTARALMGALWQEMINRGFERVLSCTSVNQPIVHHFYSGVPVVARQDIFALRLRNGVKANLPEPSIFFGGRIENLLTRKA